MIARGVPANAGLVEGAFTESASDAMLMESVVGVAGGDPGGGATSGGGDGGDASLAGGGGAGGGTSEKATPSPLPPPHPATANATNTLAILGKALLEGSLSAEPREFMSTNLCHLLRRQY